MGLLDGIVQQQQAAPAPLGIGGRMVASAGSAANALGTLGNRQALQQEAINRFMAIGSPDAQRLAKMIAENPRAAQAMASSYGGLGKLEAIMKGEALRTRATQALQGESDPMRAYQRALGAGMPAQNAATLAKTLAEAQVQRGGAGSAKADSRILASRALLSQLFQRKQWKYGPKALRHLMAGSDPFAILGTSAEDKRAAQLWSAANKPLSGENAQDFQRWVQSVTAPVFEEEAKAAAQDAATGSTDQEPSGAEWLLGAAKDALKRWVTDDDAPPEPAPESTAGESVDNPIPWDGKQAFVEGRYYLVENKSGEKMVAQMRDGEMIRVK